MVIRKILNYSEILEKYPDWELDSTDTYGREETPELTEKSRLSKKEIVGNYARFLQDHGLAKHTLCKEAPNIPDRFTIYLRDITPEGYELHQLCYLRWLGTLDRRMGRNPEDTGLLKRSLSKLRTTKK